MADDKNRDKMLPKGWRKETVQRKSGSSAGKFDTYIFSPDNRKFRSRVEIANYIKEKKLSLKADNFDFTHNAPTSKVQTPKSEKKEKAAEKANESDSKKSRNRPSGTPAKLLVKMPFSDKKADKTPSGRRAPEAKVASEAKVEKRVSVGRKDSKAKASTKKDEPKEDNPGDESELEQNKTQKKGKRGRQKKPEAVTNVDENTQDYSEQEKEDTTISKEVSGIPKNVDLHPPSASQLSEEKSAVDFFAKTKLVSLENIHNLNETDTSKEETLPLEKAVTFPQAIAEVGLGDLQRKRIRTPKLFPDDKPSVEARSSQEDALAKSVRSFAKKESEAEGSRKKKGGRPKKVETQPLVDMFAKKRIVSHFDSPSSSFVPTPKIKKLEAKKRKVDFEDDLELIAQDAMDYGQPEEMPVAKKERKTSGGRSSWGEIRHPEGPVDIMKEEKEAKKEKERGKFFETVILTGSRERKKSGWMNDDWVDPETITSLQWHSGGRTSYDRDENLPRSSTGGRGGGNSGRKKIEKFSYDKAKEDSLLADLYGGTYGEPSGLSQSRNRTSRKSYDTDDDMGSGSALRMHLSLPNTSAAASNIDEMFIAEQSKNRESRGAGRMSSVGMLQKVGNSFLSKALGERKERTLQEDVPQCICPHPSDDHTYSSLIVRQQHQGDSMLGGDEDDFGSTSDISLPLLHGSSDEMKMMVAPAIVALPNGGRHQQQQQFVLPVMHLAAGAQHNEKVAVQFLPVSTVNNGFPTAVLENGLVQTEQYRANLADDVSGTSVGESLPLVLMEDDVLDRSDSLSGGESAAQVSGKSPSSHIAQGSRMATATR